MSTVTADPVTTTRPWTPPGAVFAAVGGALLLAVTNAVVGYMTAELKIEDARDAVAQAARFPELTQLGAATALAAAVLMVPGIWAVTAVLSARARRLAAVGGWLMASGYVLSVALAVDALTVATMAAGGGDPAAFADAVDQHTLPVTGVMYGVFGLGALLGGLLLGIAMLRQGGAVPAWAGWALIASEPVRVVGLVLGLAPLPALASVLIAVAFGGTLVASRRAD